MVTWGWFIGFTEVPQPGLHTQDVVVGTVHHLEPFHDQKKPGRSNGQCLGVAQDCHMCFCLVDIVFSTAQKSGFTGFNWKMPIFSPHLLRRPSLAPTSFFSAPPKSGESSSESMSSDRPAASTQRPAEGPIIFGPKPGWLAGKNSWFSAIWWLSHRLTYLNWLKILPKKETKRNNSFSIAGRLANWKMTKRKRRVSRFKCRSWMGNGSS